MKFNVEPVDASTSFEYSSWKLLLKSQAQLILDVFETVAMRQIDIFVSVKAVVIELFAVDLPPI